MHLTPARYIPSTDLKYPKQELQIQSPSVIHYSMNSGHRMSSLKMA